MEWSSRRVLLLCAVLMLISAGVTVVALDRRSDDIVLRFEPIGDTTTATVYVGGAVKHPGLYTLPSGSRLATAIDRAEALDDADFSGLRMADPIQDKMTVFVPHRSIQSISPAAGSSTAVSTTQASATSTPATPDATSVQSGPHSININTASLSELESLPGIGPALAQRIIDYRLTHGPFSSPDDLAAVKGISVRMVDKFRSQITTGSAP